MWSFDGLTRVNCPSAEVTSAFSELLDAQRIDAAHQAVALRGVRLRRELSSGDLVQPLLDVALERCDQGGIERNLRFLHRGVAHLEIARGRRRPIATIGHGESLAIMVG